MRSVVSSIQKLEDIVASTFKDSETVMQKHPARFRVDHLAWIRDHVPVGAMILDPFAGVGTIHVLRDYGYLTWGVEIEPAWAQASPYTSVGDATDMHSIADDQFDAVVTSPVFGNRMSDHHEAQDSSKRNTYTHVLGEPLLPNNAGRMHFHQNEYKQLHYKAWSESYRVLKPGGVIIVNAKNFIRAGQEVDVVGWHTKVLRRIFCSPPTVDHIASPGMREGRNHAARVQSEAMIQLTK